MLEFNINGRLINLKKGHEQTSQQMSLLPKIESLLIIAVNNLPWGVASKLAELITEYDPSLNINELVYGYREHLATTSRYVLDGKVVTSLPKGAFRCDYCDEWHSLENTSENITEDGQHLCDMAYNEKATKCKVCGRVFLHIADPFDHMCSSCLEEIRKYRIKRYHDNPTLKFYDENGETSNTHGEFYGLELEVDRGGESNDMSKDVIKLLQERVYTMHDGSLSNGFEIITHPHTEQAIKNLNWKEAFKWLVHKGYRSHDISTCGLHVHINRSVFKTEKALANMLYFYEKYFDEVLKVSRRDRDRANRWAGSYFITRDVTLEGMYNIIDEYNGRGYHDSRYKCVNLQKRNTVEIRIMRGTLNYNSFMACLDFIITVAKNSNKVKDIDNWNEWLDGIDNNTKDYLSARRAFGYPPEDQEIEDDCYNMTNEEIRTMEERVCVL